MTGDGRTTRILNIAALFVRLLRSLLSVTIVLSPERCIPSFQSECFPFRSKVFVSPFLWFGFAKETWETSAKQCCAKKPQHHPWGDKWRIWRGRLLRDLQRYIGWLCEQQESPMNPNRVRHICHHSEHLPSTFLKEPLNPPPLEPGVKYCFFPFLLL